MPEDEVLKIIPFPITSGVPVSGLPDEDLVRRIREDGETSAVSWNELTRRYYAPAWHFALGRTGHRELAQDVVQAAFLRVIRALHRFDANRSFASWFYTILRNLCADAAREQSRQQNLRERLTRATPPPDSSPEKAFGDLDRLLAALSPEEREALICRHLHGMTAGETGQVLGVSGEAAKKRAQRALDKLRELVSRGDALSRIS
jgi:RNA polymerase sigma-70 factor, ECF subfamily